MEKPSDSKNSSISVNYFLNSAAYSGLFSLLSVILTGQFLQRHHYVLD